MLKAENQELKGKIEKLEKEVSRLNDNVERMCDLLLEKMDTPNQKFIYYKGDDNNSVGKLVGIDSKREIFHALSLCGGVDRYRGFKISQ